MRRAARGLGRLARDAGFLGIIGIALTAGAAAAPAPLRFELTIVGSAHQEWDYTGAPELAGACERLVRGEGLRDARFRTAAPVVVRVMNGRLLPATIRNLTGTMTLGGANNITETCGSERTEAIADCVRTRRAFRNGRLALRSARRGSVSLGAARAPVASSGCPRTPADVRRAPFGPLPRALRAAALESGRTKRVTLTATASSRKTYGPVERGTLEQRSRWRITLVRLPT